MVDEKRKKQIVKLDKDIERSKKEIVDAKETTADSMKKSIEDIELWKQRQLAEGKDPVKVEKKYQKGLKIINRTSERMDRFFDRMETKIDDWEFKGRISLEKAAHKRTIKKVLTSSLNKMEKILEENPNSELRYHIAGYCAIAKKEKINEITHPNIFKEIKAWENSIRKASNDDEYFKVFLTFVEESDAKDRKLKFKMNVAEIVNQIIEEEKISIRFISEFTKIKYANLYNFLKKELYSDLSFRRAHKLLWTTLNIKNGYSREEVFLMYSKKMKEHWEYGEILEIEKELD